jgi:hypothetical protein
MMAEEFLKLTTRADFQNLLNEGFEESLTLDYKASPSLSRDSKNSDEMCKDVSALANSAGGQIIYGIEEDKITHAPTVVDEGVTDPKISREWIIQILNSRVHPKMQGVTVDRIPLSSNGFGYVINVPPTRTGPHQAPDKKYYRRFELHSQPMEDYEIRDVMSRSSAPYLEPILTFDGRKTFDVRLTPDSQTSDPIPLMVHIENRSTVPAFYTVFSIGYDISFLAMVREPFTMVGKKTDSDGRALTWYRRRISIPTDFPIFRESPFQATTPTCLIRLHEHALGQIEFIVRVTIESPGFDCVREWNIVKTGARLEIHEWNTPSLHRD